MAEKRKYLTDRDAAESFRVVIARIGIAELSKASNRGADSAKGWKKGRSLPNGSSLINLARTIPEVRVWLMGMIGGI